MDSMPLLDDFNYNEINLDFLESPPRGQQNITTTSNSSETNLNLSNAHENLTNEPILPHLHEINAGNKETIDFNLDFFQIPMKEKSKPDFLNPCLTQNGGASAAGLTTLAENQLNVGSSKNLAKRIADVDALVRQLHTAEKEKKSLQKQMEDFNKMAKDIQLLYNKEKEARIEAEAKNKTLETQCDNLETELAAKSLELDQVEAQMEECNGPILYSELATRYLKLAHKLNEERLLHWHDQPLVKDITKYCQEKGLKIPKVIPRSPPNRKTSVVRKINAEIQCDLLTEIEKPKIQQRHQSTQSMRIETRNQGCQHIGTTTTRSTTTDCFFKYHDVGTNCEPIDLEPFNMILEEMRSFGNKYAPLSPIADVLSKYETTVSPLSPLPEVPSFSSNDALPEITHNTVGTNTSSQDYIERKTIGCCTYICNVQRPLDFMVQPPITIKRSDSRPPSADLTFETVKDELNLRSVNSSPVNFNINAVNNQLPPIPPITSSSSAAILPNAFDELWQIFGHMMYGLISRRVTCLNNAGNGGNVAFAPNNLTNQQDFYNWLYALYNNVQTSQASQQENRNSNVPHETQRGTRNFAAGDVEAASSNCSTSSTPNEHTPLIFTDAVPNAEIVQNVIKPTALRSNLKDSNEVEGHSIYTQTPIVKKSIATSPIRCIDTTPVNKNLSSFNAEESKVSAFKRTTVDSIEAQSTPKKLRRLKIQRFKVKKKKSYVLRKLKHSRLKVSRQSKNTNETAVDFFAKLQLSPKEKQSSTEAGNIGSNLNETKCGLIERQQKTVNKLRQLNYTLFGSESESISETEESTNSSSNEEEQEQQSLQIIEDFNEAEQMELSDQNPQAYVSLEYDNIKAKEENKCNQNKILLNSTSILNTETTQNIVNENNFNTSLKSTTMDDKSVTPISETPHKLGRKRKVISSTSTSPPKMSPCKRSARLLAKQVNQQLKHNVQPKHLPLLTLDYSTITKSDSKNNKKAVTNVSETVLEPACATYSFIKDQRTTASTFPLKVNKASNILHKTAHMSKTETMDSTLILDASNQNKLLGSFQESNDIDLTNNIRGKNLSPESTVSFKNINLSSRNISSLYTQPYTLQNSSTMSATVKKIENTTIPSWSTINAKNATETNNPPKSVQINNVSSNSTKASEFCFYNTKNTTDSTTLFNPTKSFTSTTTMATSKTKVESAQNSEISITSRTDLTSKANSNEIMTESQTKTLNFSTTSNENATVEHELPIAVSTHAQQISPPASPIPAEIEQIEAVKEIPLELSIDNFPTWRSWRQHQRSLLHNLISVYDAKLYQSFNSSEITETENKKVQQLSTYINEYIKRTTDMQMNATTIQTVELTVLCLKEKLQQITTDIKLIAQAILKSMQKQQRPITAAYEQYIEGVPTTTATSLTTIHDVFTNETYTTHAQRCCAYILKQMSSEVLTMLLQQIESTLFDIKSADILSLYDVLNLTDLYLLILRQRHCSIETNTARLFIAKCLYYHKLKAAPMIYTVLCTFPTVLPHREERSYDRSDALITVIQHCLMCNTYDMNNSELLQRELLSKLRFEYHFECYKPDFQEVLTNLVEKLRAGKFENLKFAFAIFCKRLPPERVIRDVLQQYFIPLANEYYRLVEQNDAYEARLAMLLDCFSTVIKPFPRKQTATYVACNEIPSYLNFFQRFLTMTARPLVQEAAIHAILRLQRFNFLSCYRALAHLRLDFELQANTKAALRTFIYRKPLSFWKTLMQQNS